MCLWFFELLVNTTLLFFFYLLFLWTRRGTAGTWILEEEPAQSKRPGWADTHSHFVFKLLEESQVKSTDSGSFSVKFWFIIMWIIVTFGAQIHVNLGQCGFQGISCSCTKHANSFFLWCEHGLCCLFSRGDNNSALSLIIFQSNQNTNIFPFCQTFAAAAS